MILYKSSLQNNMKDSSIARLHSSVKVDNASITCKKFEMPNKPPCNRQQLIKVLNIVSHAVTAMSNRVPLTDIPLNYLQPSHQIDQFGHPSIQTEPPTMNPQQQYYPIGTPYNGNCGVQQPPTQSNWSHYNGYPQVNHQFGHPVPINFPGNVGSTLPAGATFPSYLTPSFSKLPNTDTSRIKQITMTVGGTTSTVKKDKTSKSFRNDKKIASKKKIYVDKISKQGMTIHQQRQPVASTKLFKQPETKNKMSQTSIIPDEVNYPSLHSLSYNDPKRENDILEKISSVVQDTNMKMDKVYKHTQNSISSNINNKSQPNLRSINNVSDIPIQQSQNNNKLIDNQSSRITNETTHVTQNDHSMVVRDNQQLQDLTKTSRIDIRSPKYNSFTDVSHSLLEPLQPKITTDYKQHVEKKQSKHTSVKNEQYIDTILDHINDPTVLESASSKVDNRQQQQNVLQTYDSYPDPIIEGHPRDFSTAKNSTMLKNQKSQTTNLNQMSQSSNIHNTIEKKSLPFSKSYLIKTSESNHCHKIIYSKQQQRQTDNQTIRPLPIQDKHQLITICPFFQSCRWIQMSNPVTLSMIVIGFTSIGFFLCAYRCCRGCCHTDISDDDHLETEILGQKKGWVTRESFEKELKHNYPYVELNKGQQY